MEQVFIQMQSQNTLKTVTVSFSVFTPSTDRRSVLIKYAVIIAALQQTHAKPSTLGRKKQQ